MTATHSTKIALLMTLALFAIGSQAKAQSGGRAGTRFGPSTEGLRMNLLAATEVQEALKLSDEQKPALIKVIEDYLERMREIRRGLVGASGEESQKLFAEMGETTKRSAEQAAKILNKEQDERLGQIVLQAQGAAALHNEKVAEALKLTDEQKQKLSAIADEEQAKSLANIQNRGGREKWQEIVKESNEKAMALLTDEQRAEFNKMQGEKIDLPPRASFGAGRRS